MYSNNYLVESVSKFNTFKQNGLFKNDRFIKEYENLYSEALKSRETAINEAEKGNGIPARVGWASDEEMVKLLEKLHESINYGGRYIKLNNQNNNELINNPYLTDIVFGNDKKITAVSLPTTLNNYDDANRQHKIADNLRSIGCVAGVVASGINQIYESGFSDRNYNIIVPILDCEYSGGPHYEYVEINIDRRDLETLSYIYYLNDYLRSLEDVVDYRLDPVSNKDFPIDHTENRIKSIFDSKLKNSGRLPSAFYYYNDILNSNIEVNKYMLNKMKCEIKKNENYLTSSFKRIIDKGTDVDYSQYRWNKQIKNCGTNGWDCGYRVVRGIVEEVNEKIYNSIEHSFNDDNSLSNESNETKSGIVENNFDIDAICGDFSNSFDELNDIYNDYYDDYNEDRLKDRLSNLRERVSQDQYMLDRINDSIKDLAPDRVKDYFFKQ